MYVDMEVRMAMYVDAETGVCPMYANLEVRMAMYVDAEVIGPKNGL